MIGYVGRKKIEVSMSENSFKKLIIAEEALRYMQENGFPRGELCVEVQYDNQDVETFNAMDTRPILHRSRLKTIELRHIESNKLLFSLELKN